MFVNLGASITETFYPGKHTVIFSVGDGEYTVYSDPIYIYIGKVCVCSKLHAFR